MAITDTAPVAAPDTNSVTEDSVPGTATGSVLTGTGADTASKDSGLTVATLDGTAVTTAGTTINGAYGTLVIKADGSYTYTLNNARRRSTSSMMARR